MILRYVFKNFSRRKVRTILMILSLFVSTGLIVTMSATVATVRQSNVELIASAVGRYDLGIQRRDTASDPFIDVAAAMPSVLAADPTITAVFPRLQSDVEFDVAGNIGRGTLLALDERDDIGYIDVRDGRLSLGNGRVAVLEETAFNFDLGVGDTVDVAYSFPLPREAGEEAIAGASERRTTHRFTIAAVVRQDGVTNAGMRGGFIARLDDVQQWLGLPGRANLLVATVDPALYETNNAELAALRMRRVARNVQLALGDSYRYTLEKASVLDSAAQGFLAAQALINTYGLIALGVVGLLVHTLVLTNVQEQRRDMAVLRILGARRNLLFALVIFEVLVIGLIGVGLGVLLGQLLTTTVVVRLIESQMAAQGLVTNLTPRVSLGAILPAVISAFVVLIISSLKPAQDAARTRVMHAINPGAADNIQLEDLAQLRERRPDFKLFLGGLALTLIFALIASFEIVQTFGGPALEVIIFLLALMLLVLGLGLLFFITTIPFERLVLFVMRLLFPRLTYFARRNVVRGELRNTLISLLVLFSGVLPSFLATQTALENANFETSTRLEMGAPVNIDVFRSWGHTADDYQLRPSFVASELGSVLGLNHIVGLGEPFASRAADPLNLRSAPIEVVGVQGRLQDVLFDDMVEFTAGGPGGLETMLVDPQAAVISEGLAQHLVVGLGDEIRLTGAGLDHMAPVRVAAIARRLPGFEDIGRSRLQARNGSTVLMSLPAYQALRTELGEPLPAPDDPVFTRILATLEPGADVHAVADEMGERYGLDYAFWTRFLEIQLEFNRRDQATQRIFLLILTGISFTTAVLGVFAVIYVTIYARRLEIGMLKAIGMLRREVTGMLIVEAITMTLGAALAGIAAGAAMGYISYFGQHALAQEPVRPALDTTVMPFIVAMVVLASMLGAAFSARRIVRMRAVDILRLQ